jgi:hypothetical protein
MACFARRTAVVAGSLIALTLMAAPPAQAKGAESVTISGPGIETLELDLGHTVKGVGVDRIADVTSLYSIFDVGAMATNVDERPVGILGPRYVVTYDFHDATIVQEVYPLAEFGATVYFPPDQALWDMKIPSGWLPAPDSMRTTFTRLGAPTEIPPDPKAPQPSLDVGLTAAGSTPSAPDPDGSTSRWWLVALVGAGGLGCLGVFGLSRSRRRT